MGFPVLKELFGELESSLSIPLMGFLNCICLMEVDNVKWSFNSPDGIRENRIDPKPPYQPLSIPLMGFESLPREAGERDGAFNSPDGILVIAKAVYEFTKVLSIPLMGFRLLQE